MPSLPRARGFTLVELLVVLAIIGVLAALLLPAFHAAQSAVRRAHCAENLRQIGLAMIGYTHAWDTYPPGGVEPRNPKYPTRRQLAWSVFILPYFESASLYEQINIDKAFDSPENRTVASTIIATYLCPAVPNRAHRIDGRGVCHYGGIYGERIVSPNNPPKGAMIYDRAFAPREITDGVAVTLLVSEDSKFTDGQWINGRNIFDQAFPINTAPPFENDIRSEHRGGALGLFADGTVRFLNQYMDLKLLASICTREGGERTDLAKIDF